MSKSRKKRSPKLVLALPAYGGESFEEFLQRIAALKIVKQIRLGYF